MKNKIDINVIKELIDIGYKNQEIANKFGFHISSLKRLLKKNSLNRYDREYKIITDKEKKQIVELYKNGLNCLDIAQELSIHRCSISNILKENGIKIERRITHPIKKAEKEVINKNCFICEKQINSRRNICQSCYTSTRRYRIKKKMIEYKGGKCIKCNNDSLDISCYDFHHLDPNEKDFCLSERAVVISWDKIQTELDKCVLLCSNCHRIEHTNYKNIKFLSYIETLKEKEYFCGASSI